MASLHAAPLFLDILVGLVCGVIAWGLMRGRERSQRPSSLDAFDQTVLALVLLAAFALGVFITYTFVQVGGT